MTIESIVAAARDSRDWEPLVALVPYARFLGVRLDIRGDQFGACMPFDKKLIGNPALPALHGGAIGGFLIPITFNSPWVSDPLSATKTAFWIFTAFYVACAVLTWAVFLRRSTSRYRGI